MYPDLSEGAHLLADFLELVGKITGALDCLPFCVRKGMSRGGGGSDHNTHDDRGRQDGIEIDFCRVLGDLHK